MPRARSQWALLPGATAGAFIWLFSPWLTGRAEPWDVDGLFYPGCLMLAGLLAGASAREQWVLAGFSVLLGQVAVFLGRVMMDHGDGGLWPVGLMFLAGYSLVSLIGAAMGARLAGLLVRRRS